MIWLIVITLIVAFAWVNFRIIKAGHPINHLGEAGCVVLALIALSVLFKIAWPALAWFFGGALIIWSWLFNPVLNYFRGLDIWYLGSGPGSSVLDRIEGWFIRLVRFPMIPWLLKFVAAGLCVMKFYEFS